MRSSFAVLAAGVGLATALLTGCHRPATTVVSRLAGAWYVMEGQVRRVTARGEVREEPIAADPHEGWVIHEDGSLALERTSLAVFGAVDRLRRKGDRVASPTAPGSYLEIADSSYTPKTSTVVLRWRDSGNQAGTATFEVQAESHVTASYRMVEQHADGSTTVIMLMLGRALPSTGGTGLQR